MHITTPAPGRIRFVTAVAAVVALLATACSGSDDNDDSSEDSPDEPLAVELPDTPAANQLEWLLGEIDSLPISEAEAHERFSAEFLEELSIDELNPQLEYLSGVVITGVLEDTPESLLVEADVAGEEQNIALEVDDEELIETLLFLPAEDLALPGQPADWEELDERLADLAPNGAFLAARLNDEGECHSQHGISSSDPIAVGSVFKLFVLQSVAEEVEAGQLSWDDSVEVTDDMKSLPTGELQDHPDGYEVSVFEASQLMISVSDNTATDLLIDLVGRDAVEAQISDIVSEPDSALPLLDTRVFFDLKLNDYPAELEDFVSLSNSDKADYLDDFTSLGTPSETDLEEWTAEPRAVEELEWFYSPEDICAIYAALDEWEDPEVEQAMSVHDGGLEMDAADWENVWFKGGSEPGVLALSHLGKHEEGDRYFVSIMANNPEEALPDDAELEMLSLVSGALHLVADE